MRKIALIGIATVLTTVIVSSWAMTLTTAKAPFTAPAAMNPLEMMRMNADNLPVHHIVDAV